MKAVIMAGGEGKRLRPLTCTVPKPMAKIMGKPVIEYIFELLSANGVTQAAVTLGYMPHVIEREYKNGFKNLKLNFIKEDEPLGTAGSVKNAASDFNEPFIVISGDAVCDFDLEKIMLFHKASNAKITIVASDVPDPREYGIVKVGEHNRVVGFIEKPSWSQAISTLANTGVYIINPECLDLVPKGKCYDFAKDLFPLMLEKDMPIFCYHTEGYWCDIGNMQAYIKCQHDMFDGKINIPINPTAGGIYTKNGLPEGDYNIVPPVYIGKNTEIENGAVIGPYTVIDDNCYIGKNAKIRHSVILENCWIASGSSITGSLVCSGAALKKRASMFEGSVVGAGSVIGEDSALNPGIHIWPGKIVGRGSKVTSDIKYGNVRVEIIGENGIDEKNGTALNPEACVKLGIAVGNTEYGKKTGVATDGTRTADVMKLALTSGLSGSGSTVWDFGECFESMLNFLVNFCGLGAGLFISAKDERSVRICGEGGLSITRLFEREIENGFLGSEFRDVSECEIKEISDMSSVRLLYNQELLKQAPYGLNGIGVTFKSENESIRNLLENCAFRLGAHESESLIFEVDVTGTKLCVQTEKTSYDYEKLLSVCCLNEMKNGRDIAVPYDAPDFLDSFAEKCGRKAFRYLHTPADNSDITARRLAAKQIFVRDGLFLAIKLLSVMKERGCSLEELISEIPEIFIMKKIIDIDFSPAYLNTMIAEKSINSKNDFEGIRIVRENGKLLIIPERGGDKLRISAEANSMEAAAELCASFEEMIENASQIKSKKLKS